MNVKVQRNNINKFVLDTVIVLVGKVERRPIQTGIKDHQRKWRNVNNIERRKKGKTREN